MKSILKVAIAVGLIYATAGLAAAGAVAVGAPQAIAAIATIADALALGAVLSGASRILSPKPRTPGSAGVQTEYAGTVEPRRIIYGKVRVSGLNVIPPITTGQDNQDLHQVLALAGHECTAIDAYYGNLTAVTPGSVTGTVNDGLVSSGPWASVLWLRGYLGTASQTADFILRTDAPASWTTEHRGRGICYVAAKFKFSSEKYQNGKPDLSFDVRGKKCYDPRLDPSPGTNTTNPSYIAYSTNPALIAADFLMDQTLGRRVPASRIDWDLVVAAANICDENISGGSAPPSGTQKRYTCNVVLSTGDDPDENLAVIASAMLGTIYRSGPKWRMYAGAWSTSAFTLTQDHVVGQVKVASEIARREKWNAIRGNFLDAAQQHAQVEFPPQKSTAFIATDGKELWKEIQLPACTDVYEAERAALILLRQSRNRRTVQAEFSLAAFKVRVNETGTVTIDEIGWTNQTVRCTAWRFNPAGTVLLTLREEYSTDWANPLTADYTEPGDVATPSVGFTRPGTPATFTATPVAGGIDFAWSQGDPVLAGQTYRIYENTAGQPFGTATKVWEGAATRTTLTKSDLTSRDYWITAAFGANESAARPTGTGLSAAALASAFSAWGLTLTNTQQTGLSIKKITGSPTSWDAQAYSNQGFASGAFVAARAVQTNKAIIFGLNEDPSTDASYTSIDFAWYFEGDGTLSIYESGSPVLDGGSYTTATVLSISWDGGVVRYWKDNSLIRERPAKPSRLYFDSSFYHTLGELTDLTFVPMGLSEGNQARGAALNRDPDFRDASAWINSNGTPLATARFVSVTDGVSGNRVFRAPDVTQTVIVATDRIAVDATKTYRISGWARRNASADGVFYLAVTAQDSAGANIGGDGTFWSYDAAAAVTLSTTWQRYEAVVGFGTANPFPATARTMAPAVLLNFGSTAGYMEVQGVRIEEASPTSLIAPGAATYAASVFDAGPISFSNIA